MGLASFLSRQDIFIPGTLGMNNITMDWLRAHFPQLANLSALSQGGQKLVFSAAHPTDGDVVLKLIHPSQNLEIVQREILAVQQVQSPRVPKILDQGYIPTPLGNCIWLREQRVPGQTVRQLLGVGPFNSDRLLRLGLHMLEALVKAEEAHIVHRDVKPDNIICSPNEDFWLLDFGLARHLHLDSLTATALPFGKVTWGYSPPEQCRNLKAEIDARADLFALGVTIYECATGNNPFREGTANPLEMLRRVETLPLVPLNLQFSQAGQFRDLVDAMTQKRRDHRPSSALEALVWMREICAQEGI
jgi:serine/threonine-protein kinase